ncbi:subtilisin family serine protease [Saccharothrix coeruleofusca]|uniref:S8 family serine peptidase n=1 Tax=Saccharothrix coeruleofusca TaxID=33919 RepID=UPI001FD60FDF|nr:S8 family serine peptidase [Saccharothrix coeruleofusca]MBP2335636.1 subtilisin family serine protease [Saccharothrix coeruleofusca]
MTAGPGREGVAVHRFDNDGHEHVVPDDALSQVRAGRLDLRLFDVTGLVQAGYDDARRDTVPLIITGRSAAVEVTRDLGAVRATAARARKADAAGTFRSLMADPGVRKVWLDGMREPALDRSTAQIGAPAAWSAGYTGKGVKVAVLDTGVDAEHPDLAGHVVAAANFTEDSDNSDVVGHGTHVASTIAGSGTKYRGVAPEAQLLDGKVCLPFGCSESAILAGMQWAADQGADVVNLSLGGTDTPEVDPLEEAVNTLSATTGTLFVIAAGNSGGPRTVGSPGSADAALTVGAVDRQDGIAPFSSRGPRVGDGAVKPDVTAPGVGIVAAKSGKADIGPPIDENYVAASGTSMATPHVAGAAALLAQQHPDWTGSRIKAALMASAEPNPALTPFDQGSGRVDLAAAIALNAIAEPASLAFGTQRWPHHDDTPISRELVYHNDGAEPLALRVAVEATGPDGKAAPAGLLTATPAEVTVPAGGRASITVTADTRVGSLDGVYSGSVVASAGTTALRTSVTVNREVESYDITFEYTDANGQPTQQASTMLYDLVTGRGEQYASGVRRLPKGDYVATAAVVTGENLAVLFHPAFSVTADAVVTTDARKAAPIRITAPDPEAVPMLAEVAGRRTWGGRTLGYGFGVLGGGFGGRYSVGHLGPELPSDQFTTRISETYDGPPVEGTPVRYGLTWGFPGKAPTGLERAPAKSELAEVRSSVGPFPEGKRLLLGGDSTVNGIHGSYMLSQVGPSGESVDYVTTEGVRWSWHTLQYGSNFEATLDGPEHAYRAGRQYRERLNDPVFGPVPTSRSLSRSGDRITVNLPLFGDRHGNVGTSATASARTALFRGGEEVDQLPYAGSGQFEVPAGNGDFRLETEAVRAEGVSEFSTEVRGRWTFRSGTTTGEQPLPLTVVRFAPELDDEGAARAGALLRVPLVVDQQLDTGVRRVQVEASFDDGATWRQVLVLGNTALVHNPDNPGGFVSLRVKGADGRSNTFEQTVIRAYKLGKR